MIKQIKQWWYLVSVKPVCASQQTVGRGRYYSGRSKPGTFIYSRRVRIILYYFFLVENRLITLCWGFTSRARQVASCVCPQSPGHRGREPVLEHCIHRYIIRLINYKWVIMLNHRMVIYYNHKILCLWKKQLFWLCFKGVQTLRYISLPMPWVPWIISEATRETCPPQLSYARPPWRVQSFGVWLGKAGPMVMET